MDNAKLLDSHCHLDDPLLDDGLESSLEAALAHGVCGAVIPSYGPQRWPRQSELLERRGEFQLWAGFGWHPWALAEVYRSEGSTSQISHYEMELETGWRRYACHWGTRLRAVGEFGLDRSRRCSALPLAFQCSVFELHLDWAQRLKLPVILHLVKADGAAVEILERSCLPHGGVIHAYGSHPAMIARYAELGLSFSYGSALLRSEKARRALRETPVDRLLFETDAPRPLERDFSPPLGPHHLVKILEAASQILGKSVEYCCSLHRENCRRVFRLEADCDSEQRTRTFAKERET